MSIASRTPEVERFLSARKLLEELADLDFRQLGEVLSVTEFSQMLRTLLISFRSFVSTNRNFNIPLFAGPNLNPEVENKSEQISDKNIGWRSEFLSSVKGFDPSGRYSTDRDSPDAIRRTQLNSPKHVSEQSRVIRAQRVFVEPNDALDFIDFLYRLNLVFDETVLSGKEPRMAVLREIMAGISDSELAALRPNLPVPVATENRLKALEASKRVTFKQLAKRKKAKSRRKKSTKKAT